MTKIARKTVKISREKWLRGDDNSYMCDLKGKMCCLGFAANQVSRISKKHMLHDSEPADVYRNTSFLTVKADDGVSNNDFAEDAIEINDDTHISDKMRELKLKRLFKKNDVQLVFTD